MHKSIYKTKAKIAEKSKLLIVKVKVVYLNRISFFPPDHHSL